MDQDSNLTCYGCAHCLAFEKYPSKPSGERPCHFCVRNKDRDLRAKSWYDGTRPVKLPMDCYHSVDMAEQIEEWEMDLKKEVEDLKKEDLKVEIERLKKIIQDLNRKISSKNKALNNSWEQSYNEVKFEREP
jgi:hypothetical protein